MTLPKIRLGSKSSFTTCTTIEELMSEAITSDSIRTYGMSQSDKKNNSVNRLQATTSTRRRKRFEKWSTFWAAAHCKCLQEVTVIHIKTLGLLAASYDYAVDHGSEHIKAW